MKIKELLDVLNSLEQEAEVTFEYYPHTIVNGSFWRRSVEAKSFLELDSNGIPNLIIKVVPS